MTEERPTPNRRDFLTGRAARQQIEHAGELLADELAKAGEVGVPVAGDTLRFSRQAMACDFSVILNPGPMQRLDPATEALDLVDLLEDQMSVYRDHTELSQLNRTAADGPVRVEDRLFDLLVQARAIAVATEGAFDPTSGPLIALWRQCRRENRIPTGEEIARTRELVGIEHVQFDPAKRTVQFDRPGVELNLGSIGKGYALDRAGGVLQQAGVADWLMHGGHSSVLARGGHAGHAGWPIGIRNPNFPERQLATLLLLGRGMSTSGSGVQYFRHGGQRYGHLLDPRTGWPVEGMLSVTVLAPTAAEADALSTAFFVLGVEKARGYCHNRTDVAALLIPHPPPGRRLEPINLGIPTDVLFFTP